MVFTIFPKPTKVAGVPAKGAADPDKRRPDITKVSLEGATRSRHHGDTETGGWVPHADRIEVDEAGALGPSLENAALMFAHGNETAATAALVHALNTPERSQALVWMCLFDLYARKGDRTAFEELAMRFVVQFERSAPAWDELTAPAAGSSASGALMPRAKAKSLLRGDMTDPQAPVIAALVDAAKRKDPQPPRFDLDLGDLNSVNDICGTLIAGSLAALRRKGAMISFRGLDAAIRRLCVPLVAGTPSRKGQWYLVLELLQWAYDPQAFEDRAVDFAVTFEISPPSVESLSTSQRSALVVSPDKEAATADALDGDRIVWLGELKGPADPCLKSVAVGEVTTNPVVVDMRRVLRVDFICGGAIANAFTRLMAQAIDVRVVGASPIILTLLQLTGAPASLFVKTQ